MNKKELECAYIKQIAKVLPEFPDGEIIGTEHPDFIICTRQKKIGIELTRVFRKPLRSTDYNLREQEELRERIVNRAKTICDSSGVPPVHASVSFNSHKPLMKSSVEPMTTRVVDIINKLLPNMGCSCEEEYEWTNREYFPEEIAEVRVVRMPELTQTFISAPTAGFMPSLSSAEVQDEINKKEVKVQSYLQQCDEIWLVIASSAEGLSSRVDFTDHAKSTTYLASFDRIFLFQWPTTVHELRIE